jgi:hypothetical protein
MQAMATAWGILGVTLALVAGLELSYRAQASLRRAIRTDPSVGERRAELHPNRDTDWWADYGEGARSSVHFDPYRGIWPDPVSGRYVNIDSLGRRHTFHPNPGADGDDAVDVWMFGGSAMWGYLVRDRYTIPSLLVDELKLRGVENVRVHNLAQSTFNLTQEVATLVLELRAGRTPDAVVFLDGNNEIAPPFQSGRPGMILNQDRLAARLSDDPPGAFDLTIGRLELVSRLLQVAQPPPPPGDLSLCPEIAREYANLTDVVRALGASYGFTSAFYWQPMLATTGKARTEWENLIPEAPGWRDMVIGCTHAVDDLTSRRGYEDYENLGGLFDAEIGSVYIDDYGHMTEASNRVVASTLADDLLPIVGGRGP